MENCSKQHFSFSRRGMSLVEIMIAMTIFGMLAAGIVASVLQNRKAAQSNICESTALTIATGYLEQIKSIPYAELLMSVGSPGIPVRTRIDQGTDDPLYLNQRVAKTVTLNVDGENQPTQIMPMWFTLTINDLNAGTNPLNALEVKLLYEWQEPGTSLTRASNLRFVRSWVDSH